MRSKRRNSLVLVFCAVLACSIYAGSADFKPRQLQGQWQGSGTMSIAASPVSFDIDGAASFVWDTACACLKTSIEAEKLLITYADTGKMYFNEKTRVISWEVWDNYGRNRIYLGKVDGSVMKGQARMLRGLYDVSVEFAHKDTLDVQFYYTNPDTVRQKTGSFTLWRVTK